MRTCASTTDKSDTRHTKTTKILFNVWCGSVFVWIVCIIIITMRRTSSSIHHNMCEHACHRISAWIIISNAVSLVDIIICSYHMWGDLFDVFCLTWNAMRVINCEFLHDDDAMLRFCLLDGWWNVEDGIGGVPYINNILCSLRAGRKGCVCYARCTYLHNDWSFGIHLYMLKPEMVAVRFTYMNKSAFARMWYQEDMCGVCVRACVGKFRTK